MGPWNNYTRRPPMKFRIVMIIAFKIIGFAAVIFAIFRVYLSGETRKVEMDRVAVGTFAGEGLSPVFQTFP